MDCGGIAVECWTCNLLVAGSSLLHSTSALFQLSQVTDYYSYTSSGAVIGKNITCLRDKNADFCLISTKT